MVTENYLDAIILMIKMNSDTEYKYLHFQSNLNLNQFNHSRFLGSLLFLLYLVLVILHVQSTSLYYFLQYF